MRRRNVRKVEIAFGFVRMTIPYARKTHHEPSTYRYLPLARSPIGARLYFGTGI